MYSYETRIPASRTGEDGLLTFASIVALMQDCSIWWVESEPEFRAYMDETNMGLMISSRQVEVLRFPRYSEHVRVETSVYKSTPAIGYRNTFICTLDGEPLVRCWNAGPFVDRQTAELVSVPKDIAKGLLLEPKREMTYLPRKIKLPEVEPVEQAPVTVMRSDIDTNHHMNNVQHVRMANEYVPEDFACMNMRIEYKAQAWLGDVLRPLVYVEDERVVVDLALEDGSPCAVVEFSR